MIRKAAITFFGLGYLRPAPGTWGSFGALVVAGGLHWVLRSAGHGAWFDPILAILLAFACVLSIVFGDWAIAYYGSRGRKPGDPSHFVLDEVAGQWVSLLWLPMASVASVQSCALIYGVQFVLFRVFDIVKPPPARQLDRMHGAWGVLTDDLASGVYVNLIGQVFVRLWFVG